MHHIPLLIRRQLGHTDHARHLGKERMIPSHTNIGTGPELLPPLSHDNGSRVGLLIRPHLDAQASSSGIATVTGGTSRLFGGHASDLYRLIREHAAAAAAADAAAADATHQGAP
jgi:hypothetical protein